MQICGVTTSLDPVMPMLALSVSAVNTTTYKFVGIGPGRAVSYGVVADCSAHNRFPGCASVKSGVSGFWTVGRGSESKRKVER